MRNIVRELILLNNKYSFIYLSIFSLFLYRFNINNLNSEILNYIIYIPLISEALQLGHYTSYYTNKKNSPTNKLIFKGRVVLSAILFLLGFIYYNLFIVSISLLVANISVYNNFFRQNNISNPLNNIEPNTILIIILLNNYLNIFNLKNLAVLIYLVLIILNIFLTKRIEFSDDNFIKVFLNRLNVTLRINTGPLIQALFFINIGSLYLIEENLYYWRIAVASTSLSSLFIRYIPTTTNNNNLIFSSINVLAYCLGILYLFLDRSIFKTAPISFLILTSIFIAFKHNFTIVSLVKSNIDFKYNVLRIFMVFSILTFLFIYSGYDWYLLPLIYLIIGVFDLFTPRKIFK